MKRIKRLYFLLINELPNIWRVSEYKYADVLWNMTNSKKEHARKRNIIRKFLIKEEKAGVKIVRRKQCESGQ